ncbi:MAG: hypothetical protein ACOC4S_02365 [Balneolaceae bacterium]
MAELSEEDYQAYEEDIAVLVDTLRKVFDSSDARHFIVGHRNTLIIELEGLQDYSNEEIAELAGPVLDELDMDFDEISLQPL